MAIMSSYLPELPACSEIKSHVNYSQGRILALDRERQQPESLLNLSNTALLGWTAKPATPDHTFLQFEGKPRLCSTRLR